MQFEIVTDSSCNLPDELIDEYGLHILPLTFMSEGEQFKSYVKGEKKADGKIGFDEINHFRVTKNYVFLVYYNKTFAPLVKDDKLIDFLLSKNIKKK